MAKNPREIQSAEGASFRARVGVVGTGWWATAAHLPALARNQDALIAGIADPDAANLRAAADAFSIRHAFPSAEELVANVELDALIVATPHATHYDITRLALEAGLHVLVEKPFVLHPAHGHGLVALARDRHCEIVVGYPWHYNRQVLALRDAISGGSIGRVEFVACLFASVVRELYRGNPTAYADVFPLNVPKSSSFSDPSVSGGGQGQWQLTHSAALLFWLTGLRPHSVAALVENFELPVDLADSVAVSFEGGAIGTLGTTGSVTYGRDEILEYRIFGDAGHVLFDATAGVATVHNRDGGTHRLPALEQADRYPESAPADNLVDIVLGRGGSGSPAEIGVLVVELLAAMYASAREQRIIEIELDAGRIA
jgi:predicted dehydrogenase